MTGAGTDLKRRRNVMCGIVLLFWFAQYVYIPYQTTFLTSNHVPVDTVGMILGVYGGMQMCFRMPFGIYGDWKKRYGLLIMMGTAFAGLGSVMRILFPIGIGFFAGNVLAGFGSSTWSAFMAFFLGLYSEEEKEEATSRVMFYNNGGKLVAFICATLFYQLWGMKFLCALGVAAGTVATICGGWITRGTPVPAEKEDFHFSMRFLSPRLLLFSLLTMLQQGAQMSTSMSYTSEVLKEMGASQIQIGLSSIIYMSASVYFAGILSAEAVKRKGPQFWIPLSFLTISGYCWLVPNLPAVWMIWLCQIVAGLQTGLLFTYLIAEAVKGVDPQLRATALAFFQMMYAVGMTVFPMMAGVVSRQYGMRTAFMALGCIGIFGCGVTAVYYHKERRTKK